MKRDFWNSIADDYEAEIFSVFENDQEGLVLSKLGRHGSTSKTASDLGCGIGNYLPSLSSIFKKVIAVDISRKCISRAQAVYSHLPNVSYMTVDLASPQVRLPKVDVALSVNSIITPSLAHRNRILDAACGHLKRNGHLLLVVPSLESALLANVRQIEWNLQSGISPGSAARAGFPADIRTSNRRLHEGILQIDGVETKHFLKDELFVLLKARGMAILNIEKIEYPWKTEFASPPRWMKHPFPWDWLCVAQNVK